MAVKKTFLLTAILCCISKTSMSALLALSEPELSEVSGKSVGIILDDITFSSVNTATNTNDGTITINGTDSSLSRVILDHISLNGECGTCQPYNTNDGNGFTFGTASDPFTFGIVTEAGTVLDSYANPTAAISGSRTTIQIASPNTSVVDANLGARMTWDFDRTISGDDDTGWLEINGFNINNSQLKIWAEEELGVAVIGNINLHADEIRYTFATDNSGSIPAADFQTNASFAINNVNLDLKLSQRLYQPLRLYKGPGRIVRTGTGPNTALDSFIIELTPIPNISAIYNDFYTLPKSNFSIGSARIGNYDLGTSRINGIQIHHLKVALHDL